MQAIGPFDRNRSKVLTPNAEQQTELPRLDVSRALCTRARARDIVSYALLADKAGEKGRKFCD